MESTKTENKTFSFSDFEKGLMLAGYITPASISEYKEREALEENEKSNDKEKSVVFFKRVALAAEVASQLYNEQTFGRVKFQKIMYLCEHAANMNLQARYSKQAAGPFDNKFMHSIDIELKKLKWFDVQKIIDNNITRYKYKPLEKIDNHTKYYNSYFSSSQEKIQIIIDLFRKEKTDFTEICATIYACLIELKGNSTIINRYSLLDLFYNWSDKKKRFTEEQVIQAWEWMEEKGIV